ncbi:MAG: hypothetical protein CW346_18680 [Bacillaceae bacterium]|nr:hypothetical protein [Bacillaceae bacterium]MBY6274180.1 hypothetical protein [Bacillaceae bacterium]
MNRQNWNYKAVIHHDLRKQIPNEPAKSQIGKMTSGAGFPEFQKNRQNRKSCCPQKVRLAAK